MTTTAASDELGAGLRDGLRLGGGTFTRMPVTPPQVVNTATGRVALLSAPMWGLLLGVMAGAVVGSLWWWLGREGSPALAASGLCAVIGVAALAWLSRGLHLDGLADTCDGFASMRRDQQAVAIMRDPHLGALGAAGLVLVLLIQVSALAVVVERAGPWEVIGLLAAVGVISRGVLPWVSRSGTPGTDSGLGRVVVGSATPPEAGLVLGLAGLAGAALLVWTGTGVVGAVAAVGAAVVAAVVLRRAACERFGAVTGDVLGAVVETSATAVLVVAALSG